MNKWGALKSKILYGLLATDGNPLSVGVSEQNMLVGASFALTELSFHTAQPARKEYRMDGQTQVLVLPDDSIDYYNKTAQVVYVEQGKRNYLPNTTLTRTDIILANQNSLDWYEWPQGKMQLNFIPKENTTIIVDYYRKWSDPIDDDSIVEIPVWMEMPFCYLVAARTLESVGTDYSGINQWKRKSESGDPLDNPILEQVRHYVNNAHYIMTRFPPQDRERWFQNG